MNDRLALALDQSIARIRQGESLDDCLTAYPEMAAELRPLLSAAVRLAGSAPEHFPEDSRDLGRVRVLTGIRSAQGGPVPVARRLAFGLSWEQLLLGPAVAIAIVLGLFLGLRVSTTPDGAQAATVLTILQGEVEVQSGGQTFAAQSGMRLRPGDTITTGAAARAVLTFLDGSTVTLEPETSVVITSVIDQAGEVQVKLTQERGNTWTYVPPELGASRIEIDTPNARVATNEAAFTTSVEPASGRTEVGASTGSLQVSSGAARTDVESGSRASVEAPGVVSPSQAGAPAPRELVLRISGPALGHITDPSGATAGVVEHDYQVSQISGAAIAREGNVLTIRIPEPPPGAYKIALRATGDGAVQVATTTGDGQTANRALAVAAGQDWTMSLDLDVASLRLTEPVAQPVAAASARPANVAIPDRVIASATVIAVKPSSTVAVKPSSTPTIAPTLTSTPVPPRPTAVVATPTRVEEAPADSLSPAQLEPASP